MYIVLKEIGLGTCQLLPNTKIPDELVTSRMKEMQMVKWIPDEKLKKPKRTYKKKTKPQKKDEEILLIDDSSDVSGSVEEIKE